MTPDQSLGEAFTALDGIDLEELNEGAVEELVVRLDMALRLQVRLKDITDALKLQLSEVLPADEWPVPGVGVAVRKNKPSRKLKDRRASARMRSDIAVAVARHVAEDRFTGEVDHAKRAAVAEGIEAAWDVIPSFSVMKRDGALEFGLEQDDYTDTSWYTTVTIEEETL